VLVRVRAAGLALLELVEEIDGAAQVRDDDRAADDQTDRECLEPPLAVPAGPLPLSDLGAAAAVAGPP